MGDVMNKQLFLSRTLAKAASAKSGKELQKARSAGMTDAGMSQFLSVLNAKLAEHGMRIAEPLDGAQRAEKAVASRKGAARDFRASLGTSSDRTHLLAQAQTGDGSKQLRSAELNRVEKAHNRAASRSTRTRIEDGTAATNARVERATQRTAGSPTGPRTRMIGKVLAGNIEQVPTGNAQKAESSGASVSRPALEAGLRSSRERIARGQSFKYKLAATGPRDFKAPSRSSSAKRLVSLRQPAVNISNREYTATNSSGSNKDTSLSIPNTFRQASVGIRRQIPLAVDQSQPHSRSTVSRRRSYLPARSSAARRRLPIEAPRLRDRSDSHHPSFRALSLPLRGEGLAVALKSSGRSPSPARAPEASPRKVALSGVESFKPSVRGAAATNRPQLTGLKGTSRPKAQDVQVGQAISTSRNGRSVRAAAKHIAEGTRSRGLDAVPREAVRSFYARGESVSLESRASAATTGFATGVEAETSKVREERPVFAKRAAFSRQTPLRALSKPRRSLARASGERSEPTSKMTGPENKTRASNRPETPRRQIGQSADRGGIVARAGEKLRLLSPSKQTYSQDIIEAKIIRHEDHHYRQPVENGTSKGLRGAQDGVSPVSSQSQPDTGLRQRAPRVGGHTLKTEASRSRNSVRSNRRFTGGRRVVEAETSRAPGTKTKQRPIGDTGLSRRGVSAPVRSEKPSVRVRDTKPIDDGVGRAYERSSPVSERAVPERARPVDTKQPGVHKAGHPDKPLSVDSRGVKATTKAADPTPIATSRIRFSKTEMSASAKDIGASGLKAEPQRSPQMRAQSSKRVENLAPPSEEPAERAYRVRQDTTAEKRTQAAGKRAGDQESSKGNPRIEPHREWASTRRPSDKPIMSGPERPVSKDNVPARPAQSELSSSQRGEARKDEPRIEVHRMRTSMRDSTDEPSVRKADGPAPRNGSFARMRQTAVSSPSVGESGEGQRVTSPRGAPEGEPKVLSQQTARPVQVDAAVERPVIARTAQQEPVSTAQLRDGPRASSEPSHQVDEAPKQNRDVSGPKQAQRIEPERPPESSKASSPVSSEASHRTEARPAKAPERPDVRPQEARTQAPERAATDDRAVGRHKQASEVSSTGDKFHSSARSSAAPVESAAIRGDVDGELTSFDGRCLASGHDGPDSVASASAGGRRFHSALSRSREMVPHVAAQVTRLCKSRREEMRIRLRPPEMGQMRIKITVTESGVRASLRVDQPQAHAVLEENMSALSKALQEQGLKVDSLSVEIDDGADSFSGHFSSHEESKERGHGCGDFGSIAFFRECDEEPIIPPATSTLASRLLDVVA